MAEQGRAFSTDNSGGMIAAGSPSPVRYDAGAVQGPMPRDQETVCFKRRTGDPGTASSVRVGSCSAGDIAAGLQETFDAHLGARVVTDEAREEVSRIASDRAAYILRPTIEGDEATPAATQARQALATAAMSLMAVEAAEVREGEVTARHLRKILRRQRPKLPR